MSKAKQLLSKLSKKEEALSPSDAVRDLEKQLAFVKKKISKGGLDPTNAKVFGSAMQMLKKATDILTDVKLLK